MEHGNGHELVARLVAGDVNALGPVRSTPYERLAADVAGGSYVLTAAALRAVIQALDFGQLPEPEARLWASFMRRGYAEGVSGGPVRPIDIEYDPKCEDLMVDILSRLDELGDVVDGVVTHEERQRWLDLLATER